MIIKYIWILLFALAATTPIKRVDSFQQLAQHHCQSFDIQLLYRLSTGQLAETYGAKYYDIDCYVRQFVNKDGQDTFQPQEEQDQQQEQQRVVQDLPLNDPLVVQYAKGLTCLPAGTDPVQATYAIWRFFRYIIQHDYAYEWMRAKIRAALGYQAQRPSTWMDGQQSAARLRLDKLFSNQFYDHVDRMMFKDFLQPIMTFLKKNVVFAANSPISQSNKPILVQYIQSKNYFPQTFIPVIMETYKGDIFSYTIPGIPLLLGGTAGSVSWAFTGVLVDRSNIEQIETLGNKFFHKDSEMWIKLQNVTLDIKVKDEQSRQCEFVHSSYGTLYQKHKTQTGKVSQYIARWHQNERKVRVLFSQLYQLILHDGQTNVNLEFPFSSLVITNRTGIYQHLCLQRHPSYFLYPDLSGAPQHNDQRWIFNPKRNFIVVTNTHLTTEKDQTYILKEVQNPTEEQFIIDTRRKIGNSKFTAQELFKFVLQLDTDPLVKKRKDLLVHIYRKAKYLFFPQQPIRKQCDQLIAFLEKWTHHYNQPTISPIFLLWDYFFREYTFDHVSSSQVGRSIPKHRIVTDNYWTNQMELWKEGISYGQCDSALWQDQYRAKLYGMGENSTCFFNIMRGINRTRQVLRNQQGVIHEPKLSDFLGKKIKNIADGYLGEHVEEVFSNYYSRSVAFVAEIDSGRVNYWRGYREEVDWVELKREGKSGDPRVEEESGQEQEL